MGMIYDLDAADAARLFFRPAPRRETDYQPVVVRRYIPRRERRLWIERDTPIIPQTVAESVWEEACVWLGEELPRYWVRRLAVRADVIYAHNPRFRRSIRRPGNAGRDFLWMFTRHWLAAMIWKHRSDWHARLPVTYNVGGDLPERPHGRGD